MATDRGDGGGSPGGRFVQGGLTIVSQCLSCSHLSPGRDFRCDAFPSGIPDEIVSNRSDHRREHAGDRGIRFEAADGVSGDYLDYLFAVIGGGPRKPKT